ncbi:MAG TPA: hypothetical protein VI997_02050 [Candidatus Thermoplasmatota archaeon]|nr:hypothetical protein [Candidatus Thermoplasmatota archaeon]
MSRGPGSSGGLDTGGLRTNESLRLTQGSTTTGFAGVVDADVYLDTHEYPRVAPIAGTVWCA